MSAPASPHYEILLPPKPSEAPAFHTFGQESDWFFNKPRSGAKKASRRRYYRLLDHYPLPMMFLLGAVAAVGLQPYGQTARETIAKLHPQLGWLAQRAAPDRIEQISRSVDRIASDIAVTQQQMTRSIDHLAAEQEQMTREIMSLQVPQPASGPSHKIVHRSSQMR
jgi:hypothetical protein